MPCPTNSAAPPINRSITTALAAKKVLVRASAVLISAFIDPQLALTPSERSATACSADAGPTPLRDLVPDGSGDQRA
jgi:hypothetical protein